VIRRLSAAAVTVVAAAVVAAAAALLASPAPASAHGAASIALNSDGLGAVWVTVSWSDGHDVDTQVEGTVAARSKDGTTVAPQPLVKSSAPGTFVYMGTLAAGTWDVEVDLGTPIHRSCTASFDVATTPKTSTVACDLPAAAPAAPPAGEGRDLAGILALVAAGVGAVVLGAVALLMRRRRTPPPAAPAKRVAARR
jgi:hypothetical protein